MRPFDISPYRNAIQERICSFCVDHLPDGSCSRPDGDPCSLKHHLDQIVPVILGVEGRNIGDYAAALRRQVCAQCHEDETGHCPLRNLAECALDSYLLRIVEVIEDVAREQGHRPQHSRRAKT